MRLPISSVLPPTGSGGKTVNGSSRGNPSPLTVTSPDLAGSIIPARVHLRRREPAPSPAVEHSAARTPEVAIEMLDPDAPGGTFTHWLAYGLSPGMSSLAAMPANAAEGVNDFAGAATGARARRAAPRIITTSWSLRWTPSWHGRRGEEVRSGVARRGHVLGRGELVATYQRG